MKVDVYSVMYNEQEILPYWLRHYETFADRIFVWEDDSTDATREILSKHTKVILLPMEKHGDDDVYWITTLFPQYEIYSRGQADWVIIADADEFVYHPRILERLQEEQDKGTKMIQCSGFTMISETFPCGDGQIYDEVKMGITDRGESKWTIHSPDLYIRYHKGRHGRPIRNGRGYAHRASDIKLLHYRYLGEKYYEERDMKNRDRLEFSFHEGHVYSRSWRHQMPDGSRAAPLDWYNEHKKDAIEVV